MNVEIKKHSFDYEYFNKYKTQETTRAIRRAILRDKSLVRSLEGGGPVRGFGTKYKRNIGFTLRAYDIIVDKVISLIDTIDIDEKSKGIIREFEIFQSTQKGPVAPVSPGAGSKQVVAAFVDDAEDASILESCKVLSEQFLSLYHHFHLDRVNVNAGDINFQEQWNRLPSSTHRGFPYNTVGSNVDMYILADGGIDFESALEYFKGAPQNTSFTGVRLQGTPGLEEAKVRMISMADVRYQYVNVGLVHFLTYYLKAFPSFAAGNDPITRDQMIVTAITNAGKNGRVLIPFDFSKFDRCCNRFVRSEAYKSIAMYYSGTSRINEGYEQQLVYSNNQFLILGVNGQFKPVRADNLLMSGVADTQLVGSLINLSIQGYLSKELGFEVNGDGNMALGDDVLMSVPRELIDKGSYKGLLAKISELLDVIGFKTNVDKAYPSPIAIFLQRMYYLLGSKPIIGVGSYTRTIASGIFMERWAELPPGIKSIKALHLFAQIVMISEVEPNEPIHKEFRKGFARYGIEKDGGLRAIIKETYNSESDVLSNADSMMRYLIKLTTDDLNNVLDYFRAHAYDRYNIVTSLSRLEYGTTFNFTGELISAWEQINLPTDSVKEVFGVDISINDGHDPVEDFVKAS